MLLLLDIGNTHTHLGLADGVRIRRTSQFPTAAWLSGLADRTLARFIGKSAFDGAALCSVVPAVTPVVQACCRHHLPDGALELTHRTRHGVGINYPKPRSIGTDRLANAVALKHHFGTPAVAVDFGTAVTFDVVDARGDYIGGIIAPGLAAMTDYLHEKTALLPRIRIRDVTSAIGRSTREAMMIGAVHGYRGLVRELIREVRRELGCRRLPVVATGGCARLIAGNLPEITAVDPNLTLEGLRLVWQANNLRPEMSASKLRRR